MDSRRLYRHFCMMARALEIVGERWSLLVVRDLLLGPRRFTDLVRSLDEISPTRLTKRLRQLEAAGIVAREPPTTGREVWYRLTQAGQDLTPVVEALTRWGIEHALEPPRPGEPVHPAPVMIGTKVWLSGAEVSPPLVWVWRFGGEENYSLRLDEGGWALTRGETKGANVTVETTLEAWARVLTAPAEIRQLPTDDVQLMGRPAAVKKFVKAFTANARAATES
jgi:DNA-binding HxlR family transcriptional regulator